jgi:hypothetical protein
MLIGWAPLDGLIPGSDTDPPGLVVGDGAGAAPVPSPGLGALGVLVAPVWCSTAVASLSVVAAMLAGSGR